jgi:AcrR family transcriptional regulator
MSMTGQNGSRSTAFGPASTSAERRQRLLDAAAQVFELHGYNGASMQAIAEEVGITKAALYHYVRSKDELFFQVYDAYIASLLVDVQGFKAEYPEADARLLHIVTRIFQQMVTHRPYVRAFLQDHSKVESPDWSAMIVAKRDEFEVMVRECLSDGVDQGVFELSMGPKLATKFVLGACNWAHQWLDPAGPVTPESLARDWNELFLKAFRPSPNADPCLNRRGC